MTPNWKQFVRCRLAPLGLSPEREVEIIEELSQHLEVAYEEAMARGDSAIEAFEKASVIFSDWRFLESEIAVAERRNVVRP